MKILVITPNWIGDAVAAQPLFMRLAERYPGCHITALAPPWVAPVLGAMPEVAAIIAAPLAHGQLQWSARRQFARELAQQGFDAAWVLPNSFKSALIPWLARIARRVGYTGEARYGLITERHRLNTAQAPRQVDRYAQLAQPPGESLRQPVPAPRLVVSADAHRAACATHQIGHAPVVFCPGAEYGPAKRWPEAHFAALAQTLSECGAQIICLGSAKDAPVGNAIAAASGGAARNLCGQTSLAEAVALIAGARLVVTNDSGLMHVAAALDVPQLALFGSSSPAYTPPLSARAQVISLGLSCSPCFKRECPLGHLNCLKRITPESVAARALPLLDLREP